MLYTLVARRRYDCSLISIRMCPEPGKFVYSKNTLAPAIGQGELRGKSRPAGNFSGLILPTVRIIYSIPLLKYIDIRGSPLCECILYTVYIPRNTDWPRARPRFDVCTYERAPKAHWANRKELSAWMHLHAPGMLSDFNNAITRNACGRRGGSMHASFQEFRGRR